MRDGCSARRQSNQVFIIKIEKQIENMKELRLAFRLCLCSAKSILLCILNHKFRRRRHVIASWCALMSFQNCILTQRTSIHIDIARLLHYHEASNALVFFLARKGPSRRIMLCNAFGKILQCDIALYKCEATPMES